MIVTKLAGGLGNQMFQYAAGRFMALYSGADLKFDVSSFALQSKRRYALGPFRVNDAFASASETDLLTKGRLLARLVRRVFNVRNYASPDIVREERLYSFDSRLSSGRLCGYLDGYWQNERYPREIESILREDFVVKAPLSEGSLQVLNSIRLAEAICIHVRRGDYVEDTVTNAWHGTCDLDYYRRAVIEIEAKLNSPRFFVFSDDPEWARANIRPGLDAVYISHNGEGREYEDLMLMSECKHFIIANSSFSWWAAWLGRCPTKFVIAPKRWLANSSVDTSGLIPSSWRVL